MNSRPALTLGIHRIVLFAMRPDPRLPASQTKPNDALAAFKA